MDRDRHHTGWALAALSLTLLLTAVACREAPPSDWKPLPLPHLEPQVLDDGKRQRNYLNSWPAADYEIHRLKDIGWFFIDDPDDYIKSRIVEDRHWEEDVTEWLESHIRPGTVALDVGAHIGTHTVLMSELVGPRGRVYAFEPQWKVFRELYYNLALNGSNNAVALRYALGDGEPTVIEMNPATEGNEGGTGVGAGGDRVELRTLDSFRFQKVSLLKIDVEGFENPVLDGARRTIRRERPAIIIEIMGGHVYDEAPPEIRQQIDVTRSKIEDLGYTFTDVAHHNYLALPTE